MAAIGLINGLGAGPAIHDRIGAVLAGTDLALLFNESNTDFPAVDCAALHLRAITQVAASRAVLEP